MFVILSTASVVLWNNGMATATIIQGNPMSVLPFDMKLVVATVAAVASFGTLARSSAAFAFSANSKYDRIASMAKSDFRDKLGYMDSVKKEVQQMGRWLEGKEEPPTTWTILAPLWLQSFAAALAELFDRAGIIKKRAKSMRRGARLMLFIDDLDRCKPSKITEVLQAIVLLTEDTPFVVFLAVDPRVVVSAIESSDSHFFGEAGINGYEYLDKV